MIRKIKRAVGALICSALLILGAGTQAQVFDLGTVLNGAPPTSGAPWITAIFTTLFPGTVTLTLSSHLTVSSEFISEIALNLRSNLSPATLVFTQTSGPAFSSLNQPPNQDSVKLAGSGSQGVGLDLAIDWPSGGTLQRFDASDVVTFTITGPATLAAEDFFYHNNVGGNPGSVIIGAHVQGILATGGGTTSAAVMQTIPEPSAAALLLAALALTGMAAKSKTG